MAKRINLGSLPEDDPLFTRPLWIGSVMMAGQFAKSSQKNTKSESDSKENKIDEKTESQ